MHTLVRRYIKTAIVFLMAGLAIGGWMLLRRELGGRPPTEYEISAHTHTLFVGFVMMMILGVALWLFPRPEKTDQQYRPALVEAAYWLVTMGTASRSALELAKSGFGATGWIAWAIVVAGMLQIVGFVVFFFTMWTRIRAVGSAVREAKGEKF